MQKVRKRVFLYLCLVAIQILLYLFWNGLIPFSAGGA